MVSLNKTLNEARSILKENKVDIREARLLLAFSLGTSLEKIILLDNIEEAEYEKYITIINKRASRYSLCIYCRRKGIYEIIF